MRLGESFTPVVIRPGPAPDPGISTDRHEPAPGQAVRKPADELAPTEKMEGKKL